MAKDAPPLLREWIEQTKATAITHQRSRMLGNIGKAQPTPLRVVRGPAHLQGEDSDLSIGYFSEVAPPVYTLTGGYNTVVQKDGTKVEIPWHYVLGMPPAPNATYPELGAAIKGPLAYNYRGVTGVAPYIKESNWNLWGANYPGTLDNFHPRGANLTP